MPRAANDTDGETVTIYHNPHCSKSCTGLDILAGQDGPYRIVNYLITPPSVPELDQLCTLLGMDPASLVRRGEPRFRELHLDEPTERTRDDWLRVMVDNPILIERPIVVKGNKAVVGRPPEKVRELLSDNS